MFVHAVILACTDPWMDHFFCGGMSDRVICRRVHTWTSLVIWPSSPINCAPYLYRYIQILFFCTCGLPLAPIHLYARHHYPPLSSKHQPHPQSITHIPRTWLPLVFVWPFWLLGLFWDMSFFLPFWLLGLFGDMSLFRLFWLLRIFCNMSLFGRCGYWGYFGTRLFFSRSGY